MKVLFLQENGYYESIGVMYISAFLKKHGHETDLLISSEEKDLNNKIKNFEPDLIAFSCTTDMHGWLISKAAIIKEKFDIPIIVGGPHPTCFPEIIESKEIDMICVGEGEIPMVELANKFDKRKSILKTKGIWIKRNKKIYKNSPSELIQNFSNFPKPDREIYYKYGFIRGLPMKRFITGRGCPFNCAFCHNQLLKKVFHNKGVYVRKMPVKTVINEILDVIEKYPVSSIHFSDDTFILNRVWVKQFTKSYKKNVNIPYSCNIRADLLDNEMAKVLKKSGCRAVSFGVESGNENIRNRILNKEIDDKTMLKAVNLLKKHQIESLTTNMVAVPGEKEKDVWDTIKFNRKLNPTYTRSFIFDPFPNLPLTGYAMKIGMLPKNYSLKDFNALSHEPINNDIDKNLVKNVSSLFFLFIKLPIPMFLLRHIKKIPHNKAIYVLGRLVQAYSEARFFKIPILSGIRYFSHTLGSFKSN